MTEKKRIEYFFAITLLAQCINSLEGRSPFRPKEEWLPMISVQWAHESEKFSVSNAHLEEYPYFKIFDNNFFNEHLIKDTPIAFRYKPDQSVMGGILAERVEHLLEEIKERKKYYTYFTVIQKKDFSRRKGCGLIVLKFKEYPFVLKLFIETPETFIRITGKGFEPIFFYYMGGGVNRHLSGLTRLKNLEYINKKLASSSEWSEAVNTPRKWFWVPREPVWFLITGNNIGSEGKELHTTIPSTYAIIADAIEAERNFSIKSPEDREFALHLCSFLDYYLDPHISNFMIEKNTGKVVIVDTEHFPTMVGLKKKYEFKGYASWYSQLTKKCTKDMLLSTKAERKNRQHQPFPFAL